MQQPTTSDDCVAMLTAVLTCLDRATQDQPDEGAWSLCFAAIRVQEAIDLIRGS